MLTLASFLLSACSSVAAANSWPGVTADKDNAYVAYSTGIYAVKAADGSMVWRYPDKADTKKMFYSTPTLAGNQLIVGDYAGILYSLDATSGKENWTFTQAKARFVGSALVTGDTILAPSSDQTLYALDLQGKLRWSFKANGALWAEPATDGKTVYVSSLDHNLYAINISNGSKTWVADLGGAAVVSPLLSDKGLLYVGTLASEMVVVDAASGKVIRRTPSDGEIWAKPILQDGNLYYGDMSGKFYAVSSDDGTIKWTIKASGPVLAPATINSDGIIVSSETGEVAALDMSGKQLWSHTVSGKLYATPVIFSDRIVVGALNGDKLMVALGQNGNELWSFTAPK